MLDYRLSKQEPVELCAAHRRTPHNVSDLTDVLSGMAANGWSLTKELVGRLSPYTRDHLRHRAECNDRMQRPS